MTKRLVRLLIVEPDDDLRNLLAFLTEDAGYTVDAVDHHTLTWDGFPMPFSFFDRFSTI